MTLGCSASVASSKVNETRLSATTIDLLFSAEIRYGQQTGSTLFASLDTSSYKLRTTGLAKEQQALPEGASEHIIEI